jgi:hypothetical protein
MLNITRDIAKSIYSILITHVGAEKNDIQLEAFCQNMTYVFPRPITHFGFNNGIVVGTRPEEQLHMYDGDPVYLAIIKPIDWQIKKIKIANELIAKAIKG